MAEFVKKGMMGYKEVEQGYHDPECSHVVLEKEEYDAMRAEIYEAQTKARTAEKNASERVKSAEWNQRHEAAELNNSINALKQRLAAEQEKVEFQKNLNSNLLRISQERANAQRHLTPKKEHSGYVVKRSTEKEHRFRYGGKWTTVMLWETVLETPYPVEHDSEEAAELIDELFNGEATERRWLIGEIGITHRYRSIDGFHQDLAGKKDTGNNTVVEQRLSANYKSGFWEIHLLHTEALDTVPWHWREVSKK